MVESDVKWFYQKVIAGMVFDMLLSPGAGS